MAEEQACLVQARSNSETSSKLSFGSIAHAMAYTEDRLGDGEGPGDSSASLAQLPESADNESGELIDYSDACVLDQFHEDALRQAGCGVAQARIYLACSLALAGATLELSAIPFVLPSCEIELCILPHEKNWLVLISLVGGSLGAVGWGALATRLGRRRALLSALAVNAVFAAIAAFMPTYGTFMMARFCSAIGSGGVVPTCFAYCVETTPLGCRRRLAAALAGAQAAGALLAAALARAVLPPTGAAALRDDREHFSAWHRYLLLCTLPILASLASLIWTQESPRYLLDVGREADAMLVYQGLHSGNQSRVCGAEGGAGAGGGGGAGGAGGAGAGDGACGLRALAPGKRPAPLHHVRHSVKMFWQAFFQLFSSAYRNTTLSLGGVMVFSMAIQFFLSSYIPSAVLSIENQKFEASKRMIENRTFENVHYNETLENVQYSNVTFYNCTFRDLMLSHVSFNNCSFYDVVFSNIKTSYAYFIGSLFVNSTIIDTDITVGREIDSWSVLNSTVIRGIRLLCARHAPLTWRLRGLLAEHLHAGLAALLASLLAGVLAPALAATGRRAPRVILCVICACLSPSLLLVQSETALYVTEAVYRVFLTLVFYIACVGVVESYPANLRCTAHGLIMSVAYMGGAVVKGVGEVGPVFSAGLCLVLASAAAALASRLR